MNATRHSDEERATVETIFRRTNSR
jgi:hypothetical protein